MRQVISIMKNTRGSQDLGAFVQNSLNGIQNNLIQGTETVGVTDEKLPSLQNGSSTVRLGPPNFLELAFYDGQGNRRAVMIPMGLNSGLTIADVATGGGATAAANATAINAILALLRAAHILES